MALYYVKSDAGGGGAGTIGDPWTLAEALGAPGAGSLVAGDEVRILNDATYQPTAQIHAGSAAVGATSGAIKYWGRNAADTDYEQVTISGASLPASTDLLEYPAGSWHHWWRDVRLTAATESNLRLHSACYYMRWERCRIDNAAGSGLEGSYPRYMLFLDCEIDHNGSRGVMRSQFTKFVRCRFHHNGNEGAYQVSGCHYEHCAFYRNGTTQSGVYVVAANHFDNCVFLDNAQHGLRFDYLTYDMVMKNCVFKDNAEYGLYIDHEWEWINVVDHNCYHGNGTGSIYGQALGANSIEADPLFESTIDGAEDFRLQAGSPCRGIGFPGDLISIAGGTDWPDAADIGIAHLEVAGGGGSSVVGYGA